MKKVLTLVAIAGMFSFYACGPSQAEKDAATKHMNDSIAAKHQQDSIAAATMKQHQMDSLKMVASKDSIAKLAADSAANKPADKKMEKKKK
ncbi:MAG: hypothetical protein ABI199_09675 [Bacteroidia bacterium]